MIYIILLMMLMVIWSFAPRLFSAGTAAADRMLAAAVLLAAAAFLSKAVVRKEMLSDLAAVGIRYTVSAFGSVVFCIAAAVIASLLMTRKHFQNIHYK